MNNVDCYTTVDEYKQIIDDFNYKYGLEPDDEIKNKILNLISSNFREFKNFVIILSDDQENCFNRIKREISLQNINDKIPGLYNVNYNISARPTKTMKIIHQKDGGMKGNALTMIQLIMNE